MRHHDRGEKSKYEVYRSLSRYTAMGKCRDMISYQVCERSTYDTRFKQSLNGALKPKASEEAHPGVLEMRRNLGPTCCKPLES